MELLTAPRPQLPGFFCGTDGFNGLILFQNVRPYRGYPVVAGSRPST
jgi:hypothetical protein